MHFCSIVIKFYEFESDKIYPDKIYPGLPIPNSQTTLLRKTREDSEKWTDLDLTSLKVVIHLQLIRMNMLEKILKWLFLLL